MLWCTLPGAWQDGSTSRQRVPQRATAFSYTSHCNARELLMCCTKPVAKTSRELTGDLMTMVIDQSKTSNTMPPLGHM